MIATWKRHVALIGQLSKPAWKDPVFTVRSPIEFDDRKMLANIKSRLIFVCLFVNVFVS